MSTQAVKAVGPIFRQAVKVAVNNMADRIDPNHTHNKVLAGKSKKYKIILDRKAGRIILQSRTLKTTNRCKVTACKWHDPMIIFGCSRIIRSGWTRKNYHDCPLRKENARLVQRECMKNLYLKYQKTGYNKKYYKTWRLENKKLMRIYFTLRRLKPKPLDVIIERCIRPAGHSRCTIEYIVERTIDYCFKHTWKTLRPLLENKK